VAGEPIAVPLTASLIAFVALSIYLGQVARKKGALASIEQYYLGGRLLGRLHFFLSYFSTTYSAFMLVGLVGYSYLYGVGTLGFELIYLMGTAAILSMLGPRIYERARELRVVSPAQLVYGVNGSKVARYIIGISYLAFMVPYMSVQVIGPAAVLSRFGVPREAAIVATLATVFLYVFYGGLRGVVYTDVLQGVFFLAVAIAFALYLAPGLQSSLGYLHTLPGGMGFWTPERFVSLTLPWIFFALTNPQVLQRIYMARSREEMARGSIMFLAAGFVLTICMVVAGMGASGILRIDTRDPNAVTPSIMASYLPDAMVVALALAVWAAALATLDSILLTLASVIDIDILGRGSVRVGRLSVLGIIVVLGVFSFYVTAPVVALAVASSAALLYLAPILVIATLRGLSRGEAALLTLAGFTTFVALYILRSTIYPHPLDYPAIASLAVTSALSAAIYMRPNRGI